MTMGNTHPWCEGYWGRRSREPVQEAPISRHLHFLLLRAHGCGSSPCVHPEVGRCSGRPGEFTAEATTVSSLSLEPIVSHRPIQCLPQRSPGDTCSRPPRKRVGQGEVNLLEDAPEPPGKSEDQWSPSQAGRARSSGDISILVLGA